MSKRMYTSEEAYAWLSLTDVSDGEASLSDHSSAYEPVDNSGSLSDSSDDGVVPAKVRRTRSRTVAGVQEPQGSRMEQRPSTSAAHSSGDLASASGLVHPGQTTSTAVTLGDVASPISAVKAGVARVPPPRRQRQARRTHSALPAAFANPDWQPSTDAAPILPPFTGQPGIQVNTANFMPIDFYSLYFTDDLYRSIVIMNSVVHGETLNLIGSTKFGPSNHFNHQFAALYNPQQVVCVDESLVKFSGRLAFRQYVPSKRARYGVKMYKLCDRAMGYTYSFRVYEGKDSQLEPPNCPDYIGCAGKIVWDLVSPLFGKDNYYTSVPLFSHLFDQGIGACRTVRPNRRGLPQRLVESRLRQGEYACLKCNNLLALKWRDNRNVFVLSSLHADTTVQVTTVAGVVEKPLCVHAYNLNMGGVDFNDQLLAPYLMTRKARRWYKKVSLYLFQLALLNAYVLYIASKRTLQHMPNQDQRRTSMSLVFVWFPVPPENARLQPVVLPADHRAD